MIIKDFLDEILEEVQISDDDELRDRLIRNKLTYIEDEMLSFIPLISKTYEMVVPASLQVRLPYDFRYPKAVFVGETEVFRMEKHEVDNWSGDEGEGTYNLDIIRLEPSKSRRLILKASDFESLNIPVLRSDEDSGYSIKLMNDAEDTVFGEIHDSENVYRVEDLVGADEDNVKLKVFDSGDDPALYADVERIEDDDILEMLTRFGLYKIKLKDATTEYFLAENGNTYSQAGLTTLLTKGALDGNCLFLNFDDIEAGDEVKIEYYGGAKRYINENQVCALLDMFKNLMFKGMVWQAYKHLRKTQSAREWKEDFYNDLQNLSGKKAGRIKSFGKQKLWRPRTSRHAFRLRHMR